MIGDEAVISMTVHEGASVVRLRGDLGEDSAPGLAQALATAVTQGASRTVVDLSEAEFADSSVLHALLDARNAHRAADVALVLAGPLQGGDPPTVRGDRDRSRVPHDGLPGERTDMLSPCLRTGESWHDTQGHGQVMTV
ncbi:hypothetical protein GCM10020254_04910 [Streptomyces goshikiensis]